MPEMSEEEKTQLYMRLNKIDSDIQRLLYILESDSRINNKGLVERVQENRAELDKLLLREKVLYAKAGVWGVIGSVILSIVVYIVKFLFISK